MVGQIRAGIQGRYWDSLLEEGTIDWQEIHCTKCFYGWHVDVEEYKDILHKDDLIICPECDTELIVSNDTVNTFVSVRGCGPVPNRRGE